MKRLLVIITTLLCLAVPATAAAYSPLTDACGAGNGAAGSAACTSNTGADPISGKNGILTKVSLVLASIAGIAAIIIIMLSGFRYITSSGDSQKAASARNGILGAAVGLAIIAGAEGIVLFVVSKL
jgi:uncharacterized protein (DUF2345 family)